MKNIFCSFRKYLAVFFGFLVENRKAKELHSGVLVAFYLILLSSGILLFNSWNYVPTRDYCMQIEEVKSNSPYKCTTIDSIDMYWKSSASIMFHIPMTFQERPYREFGGVEFQFGAQLTNSSSDTTALDRYYFARRYKSKEYADSIYRNLGLLERLAEEKNISDKQKIDSILTVANSEERVPDIFKNNIYYISLTRNTNERYIENMVLVNGTTIRSDQGYSCRVFNHGPRECITTECIISSFYAYLKSDICQDRGSLFTPSWFNFSDISQSYFSIGLKTCTVDNIRLEINFEGVTEFSKLNPEPDSITMNSIVYHDVRKISQIKRNGLRFYASFKELENKQAVRNFALTTLMSLLIGTLFKEIFIMAYSSMTNRRKEES